MKILVACAGTFSHGLDSPERGEGRWAQNVARMLGAAGHQVFACSGGRPQNGEGRPAAGVKLLAEGQTKKHGPYDLYIDSCWWEGKPVPQAKYYFRIHWALEQRLRKPLPKNHFIIYPYYDSKPNFIHEVNPNNDRTFFLPTPFCDQFVPPQFNNKWLLWPSRATDVFGNPHFEANGRDTVAWAKQFIEQNPDHQAHWFFEDTFKKYKNIGVKKSSNHRFHGLLPYNKALEVFAKVKLNLAVNLPSCSIDCAAAGAATLVWELGSWDKFREIAVKHDLLIQKGSGADRIAQVADRLMKEEETFNSYVLDFQHTFRHHTTEESLKIFNEIVSKF